MKFLVVALALALSTPSYAQDLKPVQKQDQRSWVVKEEPNRFPLENKWKQEELKLEIKLGNGWKVEQYEQQNLIRMPRGVPNDTDRIGIRKTIKF